MLKLNLPRKAKKDKKKQIEKVIDTLKFRTMDEMLEINGLLEMKEEKCLKEY